jgi:hypothetical protein|tara:strand:- start:7077 stop:8621 length:1545 start_codon:yes stop_codon:yes gene_type:complete
MAYKFQFGQAILSGALDQEGDVQVKAQDGSVKIKLDDNGIISGSGNFQLKGDLVMSEATRINAAGAGSFVGVAAGGAITTATDIDGSGDLTMGTITMTGFAVDADGDTALKSLAVDNNSTIGCDADTDMMTFAAQTLTIANDVDFNVNKAGGLQIAGAAVTSTAAELNFNDGATAGTAVASKTVVLDASKDIAGLGQLSAVGLSGSLRFSLDVEADGGLGMTPFQNSANVADLKISASFMPAADVAVAEDQLMMLDADGSVKRESFADYATAIAGDGLAATSGVLSVGVDDSSIETNSDALRIKALGVTNAMLAGSIADSKLNQITTGDKVAGSAVQLAGTTALEDDSGLKLKAATAGVGLAISSQVLSVDLNELSAADIDVAADSIAIIDANDGNASKKESIADLVAGMAGAGLSAASGQLSVQGNSVAIAVDGSNLSEGYNFATGSAGGTVLLPASPSVGDVVTVKNSTSGILVVARGDAGHDIDEQSAVVLESPLAAVTCVYMVANKWKIV